MLPDTEEEDRHFESRPDPVDRATDYEMMVTQTAIAEVSRKARLIPDPIDPGYCDICEKPMFVEGTNEPDLKRRFCSVSCRDRHELELKHKLRNGRK